MYKPSTELGRIFQEYYSKLNEFFQEYDSNIARTEKNISLEISNFFSAINSLPEDIAKLDYSLTVLFEIDQSILGTYGSKIFSEGSSTPLRALLRDIMALWYRYELLGKLERTHASYYSVVGVRSFYESWLDNERVGIDESEYERVLRNVVILLENKEDLDIKTRLQLFSLLGHIIVILGITKEDAERVFLKYSYDIKSRTAPSLNSLAEILLNIYVLYATNIDLQTLQNTSIEDLQKAVRYLSATRRFAEILFKEWKVYWENDYFSTLSESEISTIESNPNCLRSMLKNPSVKMGIGHSFIEYLEYKKQNIGQAIIFNPIPLFMLGSQSSGKSSFLAAFCYDSQMKTTSGGFGSDNIVLGKELQAFYQNSLENWKTGRLPATNGCSVYSFWEDLTIISFNISDYNGSNIQPGQWDKELLKQFFNAKALLFFIDDTDFADNASLRQKAALFETNLQYWAENNPRVKNIPIALIITKADVLLQDSIYDLKRTYIIPDNLVPETLENNFQGRITIAENTDTYYGRFCDCIINDKLNNQNPLLQDVVQTILSNFSPFFKRVFDITYNYQIFLTSSKAPSKNDQGFFPFGVRQPIAWSSRMLEKIFIDETLVRYSLEEATLNKELSDLEIDVVNLHKVLLEFDQIEAKILETEDNKSLWGLLVKKETLKDLNRRKNEADQKFNRILKDINYESTSTNKRAIVQAIEKMIDEKRLFIGEMKNKRTMYENRK